MTPPSEMPSAPTIEPIDKSQPTACSYLGDTVYEQKIDFFYDFPERLEYRRQMIEGLCSYVR